MEMTLEDFIEIIGENPEEINEEIDNRFPPEEIGELEESF